jgi:hypothetical protein
MKPNLNEAIRAAEAGDATMLTQAMAAFGFAGADYPVAMMRELRNRFPQAHAEACSDKYYEAARLGTLDKLFAKPVEHRAAPAPSEKAAPVTSTWDDILLSRRLGLRGDGADEDGPDPTLASKKESMWDEVIANVNQRYFNSVAANRGHPSAENG